MTCEIAEGENPSYFATICQQHQPMYDSLMKREITDVEARSADTKSGESSVSSYCGFKMNLSLYLLREGFNRQPSILLHLICRVTQKNSGN